MPQSKTGKAVEQEESLSPEENYCHTYACAIQECLQRRGYDEKKCRKEIQRWKLCLKTAREAGVAKPQ